MAAEVFPASVRSTAHGVSAAFGKLGALTATIAYNYIDTETKIWVVCWFGLAGAALTVFFVPDTTGLDLREQERYWSFVRDGRASQYHGIAINRQHLSSYEIYVLGRHKNYDPELDSQMRIEELRNEYQASLYSNEKDDNEYLDDLDPRVVSYFERRFGVKAGRSEKATSNSDSQGSSAAVQIRVGEDESRKNTDSLFREMNRA